jgi:hypothetical protein
MSKRLQVILDTAEYRELQKTARRNQMTVSAWVRTALRHLGALQPIAGPDRKLQAIRAAARNAFPAPPIDDMLREIERGYLGPRA